MARGRNPRRAGGSARTRSRLSRGETQKQRKAPGILGKRRGKLRKGRHREAGADARKERALEGAKPQESSGPCAEVAPRAGVAYFGG